MSGSRSEFGRAAVVAIVVVALDQLTKAIVRGQVSPGESIDVVAGIDLVLVYNRGIAFGLLDDAGAMVLVLVAVAFAAMLGVFLASAERRGLWLPIGLLAGGAIGNLIDRVREGAVTDFVDIGPWPAFNLADVSITVGVILLVLVYAFGAEPESDEGPAEVRDPPSAGTEAR